MFRQATPFVNIITAARTSSRHYVSFGTGVDGHPWAVVGSPERDGVSGYFRKCSQELVDTG
jgi:hypothetical protein